jgi:hypothetical protein
MSRASGWPLVAGLGPLGALPTAPRLARSFTVVVLGGWKLAGTTFPATIAPATISRAGPPSGSGRY